MMKRSRRVGFGSSARRHTPPQLEPQGFIKLVSKPEKCNRCTSPGKRSSRVLALTATQLRALNGEFGKNDDHELPEGEERPIIAEKGARGKLVTATRPLN